MNNRPIKFRAWYKPDFQTKSGPLKFIQVREGDSLWFVCEKDEGICYPFNIPFEDEDWIVQQFVGLLDSEGKEIYEGDIIQELIANASLKAVGICQEVLGGWKIFSHPNSSICWHGWGEKVIGNIFQNQEFLTK